MQSLPAVWLFIAFLQNVRSVKIEIKYDITRDYFYQYGEALDTIVARSKLECVMTCSETDACRSVVFDPTAETCTANRWTVTGQCDAGSGCLVTRPVVYASKLLQTTIGLACRISTDCVDLNSECGTSRCRCKTGYTYNSITQQCDVATTSSGSGGTGGLSASSGSGGSGGTGGTSGSGKSVVSDGSGGTSGSGGSGGTSSSGGSGSSCTVSVNGVCLY